MTTLRFAAALPFFITADLARAIGCTLAGVKLRCRSAPCIRSRCDPE